MKKLYILFLLTSSTIAQEQLSKQDLVDIENQANETYKSLQMNTRVVVYDTEVNG